MAGGKQYTSVMDMILDDEMYYKLYFLIERCNNFFSYNQSLNQSYFGKQEDNEHGCSIEIGPGNMYYRQYMNNNAALSYVIKDNYWRYWNKHSVTSKQITVNAGAQHTSISPFTELLHDSMYDNVGWYVSNNIITDEMEGELFQHSTVYKVYSICEMQEILNRIQNLPLQEKRTLTIDGMLMYPNINKYIDELLKGY